MTRDEILNHVQKTAAMLGGDTMKDLAPSSDLRELGLDSMDLVEVVSVLEDQFGIELEDESLTAAKTADDRRAALRLHTRR
ncbi:MAG: acyl carrier protein [Myxococcota bacterium]